MQKWLRKQGIYQTPQNLIDFFQNGHGFFKNLIDFFA